jgi:hypothetical protein
MVRREEIPQSNILKAFLMRTDDQAIELNRWINTREGANGWEADLYVGGHFFIHSLTRAQPTRTGVSKPTARPGRTP